jgi:two-component system sensor histidine kinase KdpD
VRRAAALAGVLRAAFLALVVDTPESQRSSFDRQRDLKEAVDDALDLGADLVRIEARDVLEGLEQVARSRRVTHVVLSQREVAGLQRLLGRPLADRLLERLPDIEVHLIGAPARSGHV